MAPGRARTRVASEGSVIWPKPSQLSDKLTAEYHDTLRQHSRLPGADQRSIAAATDVSRDTEATLTPSTTTTATTARRWLPARPKTSDCNAKPPRKYSAGKRDNNSSSASNIISPPLHPLSREEIEEFETLPIAVRRKVSYDPPNLSCLSFSFSECAARVRESATTPASHETVPEGTDIHAAEVLLSVCCLAPAQCFFSTCFLLFSSLHVIGPDNPCFCRCYRSGTRGFDLNLRISWPETFCEQCSLSHQDSTSIRELSTLDWLSNSRGMPSGRLWAGVLMLLAGGTLRILFLNLFIVSSPGPASESSVPRAAWRPMAGL